MAMERKAVPKSAVRGMIDEIRERQILEVSDNNTTVTANLRADFGQWMDVDRLIACLQDSEGSWAQATEDYLVGHDPSVTESVPPGELLDMLLDSVLKERKGVFWDRFYERLLPLKRDLTEHMYGH